VTCTKQITEAGDEEDKVDLAQAYLEASSKADYFYNQYCLATSNVPTYLPNKDVFTVLKEHVIYLLDAHEGQLDSIEGCTHFLGSIQDTLKSLKMLRDTLPDAQQQKRRHRGP
jgi:hypothetical protein